MDKTLIKNRVAELMRENGWTEAETAERASTTQSTIHRIISGEISSPRLSTLSRIADAFGVTLSVFYDEAHRSSVSEPHTEYNKNSNIELSQSVKPTLEDKNDPASETIRLLKNKKLKKEDYKIINTLIKHLYNK